MARPDDGGGARRAGRARALARGARDGRSGRLTPRRAALATVAALLLVYLATLAPGVTFWDAGELIAAAHGFGIPHPPGTPLFVALGRAWIVVVGGVLGPARAMNALSALCTAGAGGLTAWIVARETRAVAGGAWGAVTGAATAGLMCTAWANATETEVYALALAHVAAMLACALRAADEVDDARWLALTAYLVALAPAVHLSVLLGTPAAIALAARRREGGWATARVPTLAGVAVAAAGIGRMSAALLVVGLAMQAAGAVLARRGGTPLARRGLLLVPLAASALLIMLVRARHDPYVNQGNPTSLAALADVVARRQYAVSPLLPRQAPVWLQAANVAQYVDWQPAMGWGDGVFTTPLRVAATLAFVALGVVGWRRLRHEAPRLALMLLVLVASGTAGAAAYLNLHAGASLGWGLLPEGTPHEARERDYFFVLGFWGWGCLAGWGAASLARARGRPWMALAAAAVPLVANWPVVDRARGPDADAPRRFGVALLASAPARAVLFAGGDNDSYPLWYLQSVEGVRPDVQLVTVPLLPAAWYDAELRRRTGLRWDGRAPVAGAQWSHEQTAAAIARAAAAAGRPVAASPGLTARERSLLGGGWVLRGGVWVSNGMHGPPAVDTAAARRWLAGLPARDTTARHLPDDVSALMLGLLECPRLGLAPAAGGPAGGRDSLEVRCNFR